RMRSLPSLTQMENNSASYDQQFAHDRCLLIKGVLLTSIAMPDRDRDKYKNMQQSHLIIR
ncbi:MAG: hypothetical protein ABJB85_06620, partial [Nitrososphaerota archaeon]